MLVIVSVIQVELAIEVIAIVVLPAYAKAGVVKIPVPEVNTTEDTVNPVSFLAPDKSKVTVYDPSARPVAVSVTVETSPGVLGVDALRVSELKLGAAVTVTVLVAVAFGQPPVPVTI